MTNTITETIVYLKNKKNGEISVRTYQDMYHMLNDSQQKPKPRRQHSTHKKKTRWKQTMSKSKSNKGRKRRKK